MRIVRSIAAPNGRSIQPRKPRHSTDAKVHAGTEESRPATIRTREAARIVGVSMGFLLHLVENRQVDARKIMGRWHFDPQVVNDFAAAWAKRRLDMKAGLLPSVQWPDRSLLKAAEGPRAASGVRFVLPEVMRDWPILDDRDRVVRQRAYPSDR